MPDAARHDHSTHADLTSAHCEYRLNTLIVSRLNATSDMVEPQLYRRRRPATVTVDQRVPASARSATVSMLVSSTNEGPVNVDTPPPITLPLVRYSHNESTAR
jgi:hypothetical protein